ncbi:hypothetical protein C7S20_17640 [Christiangramia fulva]|uniref:Uncharacterized protein n=1 Tax=Christiangramia fulva TaxID=2126553 RepID=A0A2R3Z9J4_9FLAO|nr:hypothetical protein [Christiangramia fulva]AVR46936.1 hypothetical protein C7S20_17640 [Christiangramia fulva]
MKNFKLWMGMIAMAAMLMTSCSKEDTPTGDLSDTQNQSVSLKFATILNDLSNRSMSKASFDEIPDCSEATPATAEIGFSYGGTEYNTTVAILHDDDGYFTDYSEDLKIPISDGGSVTVTLNEFLVYDASHNLIWAAPVASEGADFAGYVDQALPMTFDVRDGTKPYINVDVLCFDRRLVNEYGYPFFDIMPNKGTTLCFFANYCTGEGRHYVANYDLDIQYWTGTEWIDLYTNEAAPVNTNNNSADPLCVLIPDSPFEDAEMNYLRYRVTPLSWSGYYGTIDETPTAWVELDWSDIESTFNDDGSSEYIHIFLGCDIPSDDCQGIPVPGDRDGDCVPDENDDCPDTYGTEPNGCMPNDDCIGADPDGDGVLGDCDACPEVAGPVENGGCPFNDCSTDTDGDGVMDCDDECVDVVGTVDNNGCPENENEDTCETAFMWGDHTINSINGVTRWGWVEQFAEGQEETTLDIYAGAGQNNIDKGTLVGTATISVDGEGDIHLMITMNSGYTLDELHVNITDSMPGIEAKAPGQYNMNSEVDAGTTTYEFTDVDYTGDFWIIVHTVTCGIDSE